MIFRLKMSEKFTILIENFGTEIAIFDLKRAIFEVKCPKINNFVQKFILNK